MRKASIAFLVLAVMPAFAADLPPCKVGMKVPTVSPLNYSGRILDVDKAKGTYKVEDDRSKLVDWVPAYKLRFSCKGEGPPPVSIDALAGSYSLFVGPTPHHEVIGSSRYLVVGPGAKAPPLRIDKDGTYTWVVDERTTVRGKWRAMAEREMRANSKPPGLLLVKGADGKDWQVTSRGVNPGNNRDAISVDRMDLGLSYQGTRLP